jgi:serine/threonine-protein kinase
VGVVLRQKWRLDALLGVGGMAAVYAATHRNGKRGAVKMLHLELSGDAEARARFLREGYVANAVDHPGAVSVLDDDVAEDGSVFLVMELLDGQSVDARASGQPGSRLPAGEVLAIADQVLDALTAAHGKGIVHRDLKPENLFLTRSGQVKVLDFGLARLRDLSRASGAQRLTATGAIMGTPAFLPPEQALGNWDTVDARTDLWAVGATMFTLLTGRFVHEADNLNKLLLAAMTKPARRVAEVDPTVPRSVAAIVDRALAFEQKDRWPDAASMRVAVRNARSEASKGVTLAGEPMPRGDHLSPAQATQLMDRAPGRAALASSLGPTSSEPRLALGGKGVLAGAAVVAVLGAAGALVALRVHTGSGAGPAAPAAETAAPTLTTEATAEAPRPGGTIEAPRPPPVVQPSAEAAPPAPTEDPSAHAAPSASVPRARPSASAGPRGGTGRPAPKPTAAPSVDPLKKW